MAYSRRVDKNCAFKMKRWVQNPMAEVDDLWKAHASYKKNWVNYDIYDHF